MTGLIDTIISAVTPGMVDKIAGALGTSPGTTNTALQAAIPAILASMAKQSEGGNSGNLLSLVQGVLSGGNPLDNPDQLASAASGDNHSLVSGLLGSSFAPIAGALASQFGLSDNVVSKLLGVASLLGIGGIGRHLGANPSAQQLSGLLQNERPSILGALPGGLSSLLGLGAGGAAAGAAASSASASAASPRYEDSGDSAGSGGAGKWLPWLLAALVAGGLIFGIKSCDRSETTPPAGDVSTTTDTSATGTTGGTSTTDGTTPPATGTAPAATAPAAIPTGSGVTAETRNNLPALNVYFDVGKSEVSKDLAKVSAPLKAHLAANAGTFLTVSGFNDPTGNAAANAELSKKRAQQVAAALEATGIPKASIKLEKPAATSGTGSNNAESRRVEVTIKQ